MGAEEHEWTERTSTSAYMYTVHQCLGFGVITKIMIHGHTGSDVPRGALGMNNVYDTFLVDLLLSVQCVWSSYSVLASFYELVAVSCKPANDAERRSLHMQVHVLQNATRQPPMGYRDHQITSFKASDGYGTVVG